MQFIMLSEMRTTIKKAAVSATVSILVASATASQLSQAANARQSHAQMTDTPVTSATGAPLSERTAKEKRPRGEPVDAGANGVLSTGEANETPPAPAPANPAETESRAETNSEAPHAPAGRRPRVALALGGGGARGLVNVGALRVLTNAGIPIDMVAGTSMGAIVGGLFCAGVSVDEIEHRVLSSKMRHAFYTVPLSLRILLTPVFFMPRFVGIHPYEGLYRGHKFANFLNKSVPEGQRNIEELKIPFCAVAANLLDGKVYSLTSGNLGKAIQASSAVPFLRKPVLIDDGLFVDGGVMANLPVKQARAMGADIVIAVDADESPPLMQRRDFRKVMSVTNRVVTMLLCKVDEDQVGTADVVVKPNVDGIKLLSTKSKDGRRAVDQGRIAAERALPAIKAKLAELRYTVGSAQNQVTGASTGTKTIDARHAAASQEHDKSSAAPSIDSSEN